MKCYAKLCPNYFSVNLFVVAVVFSRQISKNRQSWRHKCFFSMFFSAKDTHLNAVEFELRSLLISLLCSLSLVLEGKKSFFNFLLRPLRHGHVKKKKTKFRFIILYHHYFIYIQFHKKYNNCYCIQYAVIMNFISARRVLRLDHNKKIIFFISVLRSLRRNRGKKFTIATTPATFVIITNFFSLLLLRLLRCDHDQKNMYFYYSTTSTTPWSRLKIYLFSFQH